jgi:hypothetical protein
MRSFAREGLDLLLTRHPEAEVAYVIHQSHQDDMRVGLPMTGPWTCVDLIIDGERRQFAIWNSTGNVYRVIGPEGAYPGAVEDDPFLIVVPLEQGQRKTALNE